MMVFEITYEDFFLRGRPERLVLLDSCDAAHRLYRLRRIYIAVFSGRKEIKARYLAFFV